MTAEGVAYQLQVDYAGPQQNLPGLDQIIVRFPATLAGKGTVQIQIEGALGSAASVALR
jgi:uncharacterized protein (TIGR03437 family)